MKIRVRTWFVAPTAGLALFAARSASAQIYVDYAATGANTGATWTDAYTDLQDGLAAAAGTGAAVLVAEGTYKPGSSRSSSFKILNAAVWGGYPHGGGARDPGAHPVILSGDIGALGNPADNCYHVVEMQFGYASLNCVTVEDGVADAASGVVDDSRGGGVWIEDCRATLTQCIVRDNRASGLGAGVYFGSTGGLCGLWVYDSALYDNVPYLVLLYGGGAYVGANAQNSMGVNFIRTVFGSNNATYGAGLYLAEGTSAIVGDCVVSGNIASSDGGGVYISTGAAAVHMVSDTVNHNWANGYGGGIWGGNASCVTANTILWGNTDARGNKARSQIDTKGGMLLQYNDIMALTGALPLGGGAGNFKANPKFANAAGGDTVYGTPDDNVSLRATSPCIDAGDNDYITPALYALVAIADFDGGPRRADVAGVPDTGHGVAPIVDVGAHER
jgi:hypothetical protein